MRKGTVILLPCSKENWDKLIYKAKQILAEGDCDCDCFHCPVAYVCIDPDIPPYTQIKDFLKHNEYMLVEDDRFNKEVNRENLNQLNLFSEYRGDKDGD